MIAMILTNRDYDGIIFFPKVYNVYVTLYKLE